MSAHDQELATLFQQSKQEVCQAKAKLEKDLSRLETAAEKLHGLSDQPDVSPRVLQRVEAQVDKLTDVLRSDLDESLEARQHLLLISHKLQKKSKA
jgi:chaperonin cofactor prefoldin